MKKYTLNISILILISIIISGCLETAPECEVEYGLDFNLINFNERGVFLIRADVLNIPILNNDENTTFQISISANNVSLTSNYKLKITEIDNIKYYNISLRTYANSTLVFPKSDQYSISIHLRFISDELDYLINTWYNGYLNFTYQYGNEIPLKIIEYEDNILKDYITTKFDRGSYFFIKLLEGLDTANEATIIIDPYIMC